MPTSTETIEELASQEYKWGWNVDIEADEAPSGLTKTSSGSFPIRRTNPNGSSTGASRPIAIG